MSGPGPDGPDDDPRRRDDDPSPPPADSSADPNSSTDARPTDSDRASDATASNDPSAREEVEDGSPVETNGIGTVPREDDRSPNPEPGRAASQSDAVTIEDDGLVRWFLETDNGTVIVIRDVLSSVAVVALIGLILFGISGIWPPLVAVESGSMEPNMERGDLVFVVEETRFAGDGAVDDTGIVTYDEGAETGHEKFGGSGDVIVFRPNGDDARTPIIHRAHFWVEEGDDWVAEYADPELVNGASCAQLTHCPADHDGFVTKGDDNIGYDQASSGARTDVVKPEWVIGKGSFRIPWLGHVRLTFDEHVATAVVAADTGDPASDDPSSSIAVAGVAGAAGTGAVFGWKRYRRRT